MSSSDLRLEHPASGDLIKTRRARRERVPRGEGTRRPMADARGRRDACK